MKTGLGLDQSAVILQSRTNALNAGKLAGN